MLSGKGINIAIKARFPNREPSSAFMGEPTGQEAQQILGRISQDFLNRRMTTDTLMEMSRQLFPPDCRQDGE